MINAILHHRGATATLDLSQHWSESLSVLQERLFFVLPEELRLFKRNEGGLTIKLESDNDFGKALIKLLSSKDTLKDAYTLVDTVANQRTEIKEELESYVLYGQYSTKEELYADILKMKKSFAPFIESYYCPLSFALEDKSGEYNSIACDNVLEYRDKINEALKKEQSPNIDLAKYLGEDIGLGNKLYYSVWNITEKEGELYGRIDCYVTEELTDTEKEKLREKILGQNSDGFGEGFEQRPIKMESGNLYVSFYNSGKDYFLCTEQDLESCIQQRNDIKMGGI